MKKANFSRLVMEVVMDLPEYYRKRLSKVNLEIKDYPEHSDFETQVFLNNNSSGNLFQSKKNIIIYKWPMVDVSENVADLKRNIKSAILSQSEKVLGLSQKNVGISTKSTNLQGTSYH